MTISEHANLAGASSPGLRKDPAFPALTVACRALLILFGAGLGFGFALGLILLKDPIAPYLTSNDIRPKLRSFVLGVGFASAGVLTAGAFLTAFRARRSAPFSVTLQRIAYRLAPLGVLGFLPFSFQWQAWRGRDLSFLCLVALAALTLTAAMRARLSVEPLGPEALIASYVRRLGLRFARRFPGVVRRVPLVTVCAGALAYSVYFSYVTIAWHYSVRSGYDLALENNLIWNIVHGGQFFKSSPLVGPSGTHFGHHATLFAYVLAPIYALHQRAETLLALQSVLLGFAAVPLYLYARLYLGAAASWLIAVAYLFCPAVHGSNLYEFHYLPLSTFFLWLTLYALESRRDVLAAIAVALTLSIQEDVAAALVIWGLYLLLTGKRPRAGLVVAAVAAVYFLVLKAAIMPRFLGGSESLTYIYKRLLPVGDDGAGGVLKTVVGNPWYTVGTLLEEDKLVYAMQMLVPLALIPFGRFLTTLFVLPGILFTTLSTDYAPTVSIHYEYNPHWTSFIFIATVLALAGRSRQYVRAHLWAMALAMAACSYQYGAILQHNTSAGGPIPYKFGVDHEGRTRRHALDAVLRHLPPRAKVSCSGFTTPQVSSRPDAYSMTLGIYDAEYVLFPTRHKDFIGDEYDKVTKLLGDKSFGVVAVETPFALARRGQDPSRNESLLAQIR